MKKFSKKGILLFAAAMALCAFMMPSVAGAASWGVVGSHHVLDSPNMGFSSETVLGTISSACTNSSFTSNVTSAANLEITTASFGGHCTASIAPSGAFCTTTASPTNLPWTATAVTTSNIQIHGVDIDVRFDQSTAGTCPAALVGQTIRITGTVTSGAWTGNGAGQHEVILDNDPGLVSHSALGNGNPVAARGTIRDTQQTLTVS